jgi:hypothetical protein
MLHGGPLDDIGVSSDRLYGKSRIHLAAGGSDVGVVMWNLGSRAIVDSGRSPGMRKLATAEVALSADERTGDCGESQTLVPDGTASGTQTCATRR